MDNILDLFCRSYDSRPALTTSAASRFSSIPTAGFDQVAPLMIALKHETDVFKARIAEYSTTAQ